MDHRHARIYLASQSPRRRELLKQIGVHFEVLLLRSDRDRNIDVDETPHPGELPEPYAQRVCQAKAQAGFETLTMRGLPAFPVLAADTIVTLDGRILGKPRDAAQAAEMLRALSGREHQVISAVAMAMKDHLEMRMSVSTVRFAKLDKARIKRYLQSGEFSDKAGSYGIQGLAGAFIEHLSGSYSGVMGLPLFETTELLRQFDIPAP